MSITFEIIKNYLFIQLAILLFMAPFYLLYRFSNKHIALKHIKLNEHAEEFLTSRWANYLVACWAAAEAIIWFVIPEFLLLLVVFLGLKNKRKLLYFDIAGTTVGTILGLVLSAYTSINVSSFPYITTNMVDQVKVWYEQLGSMALFFQPFSGVPYKVFVLNTHGFINHIVMFVLLAVIIRIARYYIFYVIFSGLHPLLHRFVSRNYIPIFILSCFVFASIFLRVYKGYGDSYVVSEKSSQAILQFKERLLH